MAETPLEAVFVFLEGQAEEAETCDALNVADAFRQHLATLRRHLEPQPDIEELKACVRVALELQYELTNYNGDFVFDGEEVSIFAIGDRFRRALGEKPWHEDIPQWPAPATANQE